MPSSRPTVAGQLGSGGSSAEAAPLPLMSIVGAVKIGAALLPNQCVGRMLALGAYCNVVDARASLPTPLALKGAMAKWGPANSNTAGQQAVASAQNALRGAPVLVNDAPVGSTGSSGDTSGAPAGDHNAGAGQGGTESDTELEDTELEDGEFVIDALVDRRVDADGAVSYLVRWYGYAPSEDTWEPSQQLPADLVAAYDASVDA